MSESPDFAAYERKQAEAAKLEAEVLPLNKAALFGALAAAGIHSVVVIFDGYGDSGQIESVTAYGPEDAEVELPDATIEMQEVVFDGPSIASETRSLREVVEIMSYDFLEATHDGWENDDGAYGEFTFDVAERLDHARIQRAPHGVRLSLARILGGGPWRTAITTPSPPHANGAARRRTTRPSMTGWTGRRGDPCRLPASRTPPSRRRMLAGGDHFRHHDHQLRRTASCRCG